MIKELQPKPVITLTSDFGDDGAENIVAMVVHGINPDIKFIPFTRQVTRHSILEGAFLLAKYYRFSPRESIHIAVVDPGVGSDRKGLAVRTRDYWFVGPDNGLLYPAAISNGIERAYVIDETRVNITGENTFHGRDVFAPVAARLSLGEDPLEIGKEVDPESLHKMHLEANQVAHIDNYGNAKLTTHPDGLTLGDSVVIDHPEQRIEVPYRRTFSDVPEGSLVAYRGSNGTLELAVRLGDAAQRLGLNVGDRLAISMLNPGS